jgi:hypothetical protein
MARHKNVKTETVAQLERRIRKIVSSGEIDRVQFIFGLHGVSATALPTSFHPLVEARRKEAYAAAGSSMTIQQATEINNGSMGPVGRGHASDIVGAVISLEGDLAKFAKAREPVDA